MNKKMFLLGVIGLFLLSGCSKGYVEGVYNGTAADNYGGQSNTATAKVTVDSDGKIVDVYLDTTYTKGGIVTTKKTLGADYGMYGVPYGSQVGEWYEQVEALEDSVIENQGLKGIKLDSDGYTDTVSGCTIKIDALYKALEDALDQAKK
jgi:major membrane immunogen (membrane-anchored lipoprotein)